MARILRTYSGQQPTKSSFTVLALTPQPASLMEAIFVIYLHNEENQSADEIAEFLGISSQTAKAILQSKPEYAKIKLESGESSEKTHIAGGIAKIAYKKWKEEN